MKTDWRVVVVGLMLPVLGTSAVVARAAAPEASDAEKRPRRAGRALLGGDALGKVREVLASADSDAVVTALGGLADSGASNAALPIVELLAVGPPPPATIAALDALKKLRDPTSVELLNLYAGHRSAEVRKHAVQALGVFADARVVPTLMERLGDSAPDVRAVAAEALATRGEKAAVPRLMALLKRNDAGAAAPLGALAPVSALSSIVALQGSIDDDNLAAALGELLKRRDAPESVRVDLVKALGLVPGASSTTALVEYVAESSGGDRRASRIEAQKVIDERSKSK
ncbi:MAG: HEAT repeat domain-containing protein [Myxococcales bacterium]